MKSSHQDCVSRSIESTFPSFFVIAEKRSKYFSTRGAKDFFEYLGRVKYHSIA